jgi:O-acetylhomoserine (thiol)-lyase
MFQDRLAALEGAEACLATATGMSAVFYALLALLKSGDRIVAARQLFGSCHYIINNLLPKYGIKGEFVDGGDLAQWEKALSTPADAVLFESPSNPMLDIVDVKAVCDLAHKAGAKVVLDNAFATPILQRPLEWGADIVVHSATKFIGGHGTSIGGVIVDGGKFDYAASGRFPNFTEPDPSYHGVVFSQLPEELRPAQYILKTRLQYQRDVGPAISPFNAFLFLQGLETLSLRMERHSQNALAVAQWLEARDEVQWVKYPGLASSSWHARAERYLPNGSGAIVAFGIDGGMEAGQKFVDSLELLSHLANVGDVRSLAIHPASTTHQQLEPEEQVSTGVTPDLVRLSVGIESIDDIYADLEAGFRAAKQ